MDISEFNIDFKKGRNDASIEDVINSWITIKKVTAKRSRYDGEIPFYFIIDYVFKESEEKILRSFKTGSQVIGDQLIKIYEKATGKKVTQEPFKFDIDFDCVIVKRGIIRPFYEMIGKEEFKKLQEKIKNDSKNNG